MNLIQDKSQGNSKHQCCTVNTTSYEVATDRLCGQQNTLLAEGLEMLKLMFSRENRIHCTTCQKSITFGTCWI